jgi:hypothetical protein
MEDQDEDEDENLINRLIRNNPEFRAMLEERLKEPLITSEEFLKSLDED